MQLSWQGIEAENNTAQTSGGSERTIPQWNPVSEEDKYRVVRTGRLIPSVLHSDPWPIERECCSLLQNTLLLVLYILVAGKSLFDPVTQGHTCRKSTGIFHNLIKNFQVPSSRCFSDWSVSCFVLDCIQECIKISPYNLLQWSSSKYSYASSSYIYSSNRNLNVRPLKLKSSLGAFVSWYLVVKKHCRAQIEQHLTQTKQNRHCSTITAPPQVRTHNLDFLVAGLRNMFWVHCYPRTLSCKKHHKIIIPRISELRTHVMCTCLSVILPAIAKCIKRLRFLLRGAVFSLVGYWSSIR